jgi:16S rRNA processing protein RimM
MNDKNEEFPQRIIIGRIGSSYGVHGWLKVNSFTDPPGNILQYLPWQIHLNKSWMELPIVESQIQSNRILIKFAECSTPEQAKLYANAKIAVWRNQLADLSNSEYYWADLEGLTVINTKGITLGIVDHLMSTGANDVLVVKGTKEYVIPFIPGAYIIEVNLREQQIIADWDEEF